MKAVLMSIKPKWCELIFSGEKTVEVRKTAPKLEPPFKVYVYESIGQGEGAGAVVGEFVCDEKHDIQFTGASYLINNDISLTNGIAKQSCLWFDDMFSYLGVKGGVALHIANPKRYDTPKELGEFKKGCNDMYDPQFGSYCGYCPHPCFLTRPPQSWMYVEEIEE